MKGEHYSGYYFGGYEDDEHTRERGPFTTTHLVRVVMGPNGFIIGRPVCGEIVLETVMPLFHGRANARDVAHYKGAIPGTDVGCQECRKLLGWCLIHDEVERIEDVD